MSTRTPEEAGANLEARVALVWAQDAIHRLSVATDDPHPGTVEAADAIDQALTGLFSDAYKKGKS